MKHHCEDEYYYTDNGEITYNKVSRVYTVWDETYSDTVCITNYPFVAEAALKAYGEYLEQESTK